MGAFYDKLRGCVETDAGIDCADARATPLARMVFEVYGGPYYNAETCPAGSEPPHPSRIVETLEKGGLPLDLMFTSEEKADFDGIPSVGGWRWLYHAFSGNGQRSQWHH